MKRMSLLILLTVLMLPITGAINIAAETEPNVKIHIFPDNSVQVEVELTYKTTTPTTAEAEFQGEITIKEDGTNMEITGKITSPTPPKATVDAKADLEVSSSKDQGEVKATFTAKITSPQGDEIEATSDKEVKIIMKKEPPTITYKGSVIVSGKGSQVQTMLMGLLMLNKEYIQKQLEASGTKGITINELKSEKIGDNKVKVTFDITLNLEQMYEQMSPEMKEKMLSQYKESFIEGTGKLSLELSLKGNTMTMKISGESNMSPDKCMRSMVNTLKMMQTQKFMSGAGMPVPEGEKFEKLSNFLEKTAQEFELLPSTSKFTVKGSGNTVTISFSSPKMRKKDAKSPMDTLTALRDLFVEFKEATGISEADFEKLMSKEATIVPAKGVAVDKTKVPLGNITAVKVTVTSTPAAPAGIPSTLLIGIAVAAIIVIAVVALMLKKK